MTSGTRMSMKTNGILTPIAMLWFGLAWANPMAHAQTKPPLPHARLNVLASRNSVGALNLADAQAAGTIWVQAVGHRRGFQLDSRFEISDSLETTRKRIEESSVDLVILDIVEYVKLAPLGLLQPFVAMARGKTGKVQNYHLIVNRDSGVASIADLRGKSVLSYSRVAVDLGGMWVETLLNDRHLGRAERFFGSITRVTKPSSACLPVFFGKLDACLVDSAGWEVLTELNPQLASKLRILATSPAYLEGVTCVQVNHQDFHEELMRSLLELDQDPEGRQILAIFKGDRVVAITDQDAASARELWTKYLSFAAPPASAGRPAGGQDLRRP